MSETGTLESLQRSISLMEKEEAEAHIRELRRTRRNKRKELQEVKGQKRVKQTKAEKKKKIDFAKMSPSDREAFIKMAKGRMEENG